MTALSTSIEDGGAATLLADAAPVSPRQWTTAALLTGVMVLEGLDLQLASFSAPVLMHQWHLTKPHFSPLLAAAMVGMAVGTLAGSWAGDRYGRKPALVASVFFFGLMTLACASANTPTAFMAFRFLSGLGFGAAFPVATTMMSEWMPRRLAGKAIGIMTVGIPAGMIVGASAASWLLPQFGWQSCFIDTGGLCVVFAAILLGTLAETPSFLLSRGRSAEARTVLQAGAIQGSLPERVASTASGLRPAGLFSRTNTRVNTGLWLAVLCNYFATYAVGGWLTVILVDLHLPLAVALRGPLTVSSCAMAGALISGWLIGRLGSRVTMLTLAIAGGASALAISVVMYEFSLGTPLFAVLFSGLAVVGFCTGALQPAFYVVAANTYDTRTRSRGVGVAATLGRLGAIASSFAGGAVLALGSQGGFFALIAVLALGTAAGIFIIDRHVPPVGDGNRLRAKGAPIVAG